MKIKALVSFSGDFSMHEGEVRECGNGSTLQDLIRAKYVEEVKEEAMKENEMQKELENLKRQIEELKGVKEVKNDEELPEKAKEEKPKKDVESSGGKKSKSDNK